MNIYGAIIPRATSLTRLSVKVSKQARQRIKWFDYYHKCRNVSRTCRYYGISRKTFYKWKRRYLKYHLPSLENNSRRPRHLRQSKIPWEKVLVVRKLRTQYPYYSKYKLSVILERDHSINLSASTVGRIIKKYNLFFKCENSKFTLPDVCELTGCENFDPADHCCKECAIEGHYTDDGDCSVPSFDLEIIQDGGLLLSNFVGNPGGLKFRTTLDPTIFQSLDKDIDIRGQDGHSCIIICGPEFSQLTLVCTKEPNLMCEEVFTLQ